MAVLVLVYMYTNASELGSGPVCECVLRDCVERNARDCTDGRICVTLSNFCGICVNNTTG
jgi:hypothetical protein